MSLFGSTPAAATTTTTNTTPLFGTTPAKPAGGGLFGSSTPTTAAAPTSSVPLFGTTTTTSTAATSTPSSLFGSNKPATTTAPSGGGLFGSTTAPATGSGGLFGASTTAPATGGGGLFGSTAAPTTGGLFGATKPATTLGGGGLFGGSTAPAATTSFGTAPATANTTLGLGGVQQQANTNTIATTTGTATSSAPVGDKDATKENEWRQTQTLIRDMLPLIEDRLKKNRDLMDESETMGVDSVAIEEMIEKARGWIGDVRRDVFNATTSAESVAQLVAHDKTQAAMAKRVQEQASTANQSAHADVIKQHLVERIKLYDLEMIALQERVNFMRNRFDKLLKGEPSLTMSELDQYFLRCDSTVSAADYHIEQLAREIEELRDHLIEQGYTQLRKWNNTISSSGSSMVDPVTGVSEGAEFFPSQSSLAIIGSALRAPAQATATTTGGGLGLGGGSSLFGNTGTTSLFGSTTTTKPAFSGGSLFGSSTTTNTSTAPGTTGTTGSLFGAKPATAATTTTSTSTPFASSSGVLFSSKK